MCLQRSEQIHTGFPAQIFVQNQVASILEAELLTQCISTGPITCSLQQALAECPGLSSVSGTCQCRQKLSAIHRAFLSARRKDKQ